LLVEDPAMVVALVLLPVLTGPLGVAAPDGGRDLLATLAPTLGRSLDLLPADSDRLVLAGALVSITLFPLLFRAIEPLAKRLGQGRPLARGEQREARDLPRWRVPIAVRSCPLQPP